MDDFEDVLAWWDCETNAPREPLLSNAIQVWAVLNEGDGDPVSVAAAAAAFKLTPAQIIASVEEHYWMELTGPRDDYTKLLIQHEGE